jgi:hypothetical protein
MTALKPIENVTKVRGVPSKRYPLNLICAHPECHERAESAHHIFGRPPGADSDSWFVDLDGELSPQRVNAIPHVTGLCGSGTTLHHGDVEEHRAWIKLEEGEFVWYDRLDDNLPSAVTGKESLEEWILVGPLNPQPGSREGKPKRHKAQPNGKPKVWSVKLPANEDNLPNEVPRKFDLLRTILEDPAKPRSKAYTLATILDLALIQARDD